ncbi:hypothetical protein PG985_014977 [Apiospora marii]|uniref:Uncharacterized protein n=1 Tax=Apiospora marii TaxID=335849 RepID=A0ABR1RIQ5_9PEZI
MYHGIYGPTNYSPFRLPNLYQPPVNLPGQPRQRQYPPPITPFRPAYPCVPISDPYPYRHFPPIHSPRLSATRRDQAYSGFPPENPRETRRRLDASVDAMYRQTRTDKEKKAAEQARAAKQAKAQRKAAAQKNTESPKKAEAPENPKAPQTPKRSSTPKTKGSKKTSARKAKLRSFRRKLRD